MITRVIGITFAFDQACSASVYNKGRTNTVSRLILADKSNAKAAALLAEPLSYVIKGRFPHFARVDAITAVPMTVAKFEQKGVDHALELAKAVGRELGVPLIPGFLVKTRDPAKSQHESNLRERFENVKGCYAASTLPPGIGSVLLIDDTYITGSDLHYCAEALKTTGARRVFAACAARGVMIPGGGAGYLEGYFDAQ